MTDAKTAEALAQKAQRLLERGEHEAALAVATDALALAPCRVTAGVARLRRTEVTAIWPPPGKVRHGRAPR